MHEYKHHDLKSGRGGKVKSRKQAIAIGLSEARRAGADIPAKPSKKKSTKKSTSKRGSTGTRKKSAAKKSSASRSRSKRK